MTDPNQIKNVVVVHRGARDGYQVSEALVEAGLLDSLVTDLYWPNDRPWGRLVANSIPTSRRQQLNARFNPSVPSSRVKQTIVSGLISHLLEKVRIGPFSLSRRATRWTDAVMGHNAGVRARERDCGLLSYSYYGCDAFEAYGKPGMLFQAHPHPISVRRILLRELECHPECSESLNKEWELALPPEDFNRLVAETRMAAHTLVASSFTKQTLLENGTESESVTVIPYGVDSVRFSPASRSTHSSHAPLKLLFVGRINQRKGVKYLLEALRLVNSSMVELVICGRVLDDLSIFKGISSHVSIRSSVTAVDLLEAYRSADLFVLPSVAEGFGQVLLESLACGLPILTTTRTAAPDLITQGQEGFIVDPCRPDLLAERIEWALSNRTQMEHMRAEARNTALTFTWARFREQLVDAVIRFQFESAAVGALDTVVGQR